MMRLWRLGLIAWVLLPVVFPGAAQAQETAADLPRFESVVCSPGLDAASECGFLVVPEDRSNLKRPAIRLAIVILKSRSATPAPDPIIYLEGGPGGSGTAAAATWANSPLRDSRDIILLDQRGTGLSKPSLNCPEIEQAQLATLGSDPRRPNTSMQAFEAFVACHKRLLWEGINLAAYDSAASAADVADLQHALGYPAVNLFGVSYGTRLALTVMRDHPDGVRSVVLDSVYPPNVSRAPNIIPNAMDAFERVFSACAEEAACHARYTDLEPTLLSVIARLNASPESVSLGDAGDIMLTGDRVLETFYLALYSPDFIRYVPYLIDQLDQGHYVPVAYLAREMLLFVQSISEGMNYSVECREQDPFINPADLSTAAAEYPDLARFILQQSTRAVCAIWGAGQAGEIEDQLVVSDIPAAPVRRIRPGDAARLGTDGRPVAQPQLFLRISGAVARRHAERLPAAHDASVSRRSGYCAGCGVYGGYAAAGVFRAGVTALLPEPPGLHVLCEPEGRGRTSVLTADR